MFRVITLMFRVITLIFRVITLMFRVITLMFRVITLMFRVITLMFICDYGIFQESWNIPRILEYSKNLGIFQDSSVMYRILVLCVRY